MDLTITANEIAELIGLSKRAVNLWATEGMWPHEGGDNGSRRFYRDRLPPELQERMFRAEHGLDEASVELMAEQCGIRVPEKKIKDPKVATKVRMACELLAVPEQARGRDKRYAEIAESYRHTRATAYRLLSRVRAGQPLEAETRNHGWTLPSLGIVTRAWDPEAARIAAEVLLANRRNHVEKLTLYEAVKSQAGACSCKVGSYSSFLDLCRRLDPAILIYKDTGIRGLREDLVPAIRRDFSKYRPMECLVGDQHKADYYCIDKDGELAILELFCWLDFRTQMVWPAIAYKHYNRYTVGQALINACRWGLPSSLYTDWGKPEESEYVAQLVEQLSCLGIKIQDIKHTHAKVRHPQAKPIEGYFSWLDRALKNERIPGYMKRLADSRENELAQKDLSRLMENGELLTVPEMVGSVVNVIQGWNEHHFKNRGCDNRKSPREIYAEETLKTPVATLSNDLLEYIFLPLVRETRNGRPIKIRRSQVHIWQPVLKRTVTYYDPELANHVGEEVIVRFNPFDPGRAWIFSSESGRRPVRSEGKLICCAEEWKMINPKDPEQVAEKIEKQNALIRDIRERYRAYVPERKPIRRLDPRERQAKELRKAEDEKIRKAEELRVMRTPLDAPVRLSVAGNAVDMRTGEIVEEVEPARPAIMWTKEEKPSGYGKFFELNIDAKDEEED